MNNFFKLTNDNKNILYKNCKIQLFNKISNKIDYNGVLSDFEYFPNFIKIFIPSTRKSKIIYMDNYDILIHNINKTGGNNIDELNKPIYKPKWYFVYKKKSSKSGNNPIKRNKNINNKNQIVTKIKKEIVKEKERVEKENINKYYKKKELNDKKEKKDINRTEFKKKLMELLKSM